MARPKNSELRLSCLFRHVANMSQMSSLAALVLLLNGVSANLNQLAKAAGKLYFGSATDNSELSDSAYTAIL